MNNAPLSFVLVLLPLALLGLGCPPEGKREPAKTDTAACSKVGQTCEFSPGKLGTCVQKDECPSGQTCMVCQSQH